MKNRLFGFIGAAIVAVTLTACGDRELSAAQNYKFPGSQKTMKKLLGATYSHGEWIVEEVPEFMQERTKSKKIVTFFGVSHGMEEVYAKFLKSRKEICKAVESQGQSVLDLIAEKKAAHPEYASQYEKKEKSFRGDLFLKTKFCNSKSSIMFLDDVTYRKENKNSYALVEFSFDEAGNPVIEKGRSAVEFAAMCDDTPSTCSLVEMERAKYVAENYGKFKENRLRGESLSDYFIKRWAQEFDWDKQDIERVEIEAARAEAAERRRKAAEAEEAELKKRAEEDIKKVLNDEWAGEKTQLGGRRGKADGGFNEGYAEGGAGGIGAGLAGLLGGGGDGVSGKAKGSVRTPSERDIDMGAGGGSRGKAEIQKVIKQRTPGLRHIYNKFLKKKPGFSGKVVLKFTISPGGEIISISVVSSSTGFSEFDKEIKSAVSRWRFGTVKSGNTTVTIPITFSE